MGSKQLPEAGGSPSNSRLITTSVSASASSLPAPCLGVWGLWFVQCRGLPSMVLFAFLGLDKASAVPEAFCERATSLCGILAQQLGFPPVSLNGCLYSLEWRVSSLYCSLSSALASRT